MFRRLFVVACIALPAACATVDKPAPPASSSRPPASTPAPPASSPTPPASSPAPADTSPAKPSAPTSVKVTGIEQKVIEATNAFRADNKLGALKPSVRLIVVAQGHARNMARQDKFGDTDQNGHVLDGKNVEYRIKTGGYAFARVAENVGYQRNRPDPVASMMEGWRTSAGHRKNMLLPDIIEIGVGAAQGKSGRWYFVQLFGRPDASPKQAANR